MAARHHDKTEAPTQKKRRESRRDGQVARSPDLVSWILLLVATTLLPGLISRTTEQLKLLLASAADVARHPDEAALPGLVGHALMVALTAVTPMLLGCMGIAILGNLAQVGFILTPKPLQPKFSRLNPLKGLKQMFSVKGLWQLGAAALRLAVIGVVVWVVVGGTAKDLANGLVRSPADAVAQLGAVALGMMRTVAAVCVVIGLGDYAMKRRDMNRELRMTKQEVKQEAKDAEGDPHVKARIRQMGMAMSRNRMIGAVSTADVVITNPTHLAIALSYRREGGAPKVVARGADGLAARIRAEADLHGVPCVESKPLARVLFRVCRPGEEIPTELYQAVATVLAFLHRLGDTHRAYKGRLGLAVADSWTPASGDLRREPPRRRMRKAAQGRSLAADGKREAVRLDRRTI